MAKRLRAACRSNLIVPMALDNPAYLHTIRTGLEAFEPRVYHFCLVAPIDVIEQRLRQCGVSNGAAVNRARECVSTFNADRYREIIDNSASSIEDVVEKIMRQLPGG